MKRLLIFFIFWFIFLGTVAQAQNKPQKVWQILFDWDGYHDDVRGLLIDCDNNYIVGGMKRSNNIWMKHAALAKIDVNGQIIWKWISKEETTWISQIGISKGFRNDEFIVSQSSWHQPAKIITFSDSTIIQSKIFSQINTIYIATHDNIGVAVEKGVNGKAFIFDTNYNIKRSFVVSNYVYLQSISITSKRFGFFGTDYSSGGNWNVAGRAFVFDREGNIIFTKKQDDVATTAGIIDADGSIYLSYTEPVGISFVTIKFDSAGNEIWKRYWDGNPRYNTNQVAWIQDVIPYPTGGCIVVGSIGKDTFGLPISANLRDFGVVAYNQNGQELWYIRDEAGYKSERNDLWAAGFDRQNYLILVGSSSQKWDGKSRIVIQKWYIPGITTVEDELNPNLKNYELYQNYPNPFNPTTTIRFTIPHRKHVTLKVFDVLGKEVKTLVNEEKDPGSYEVKFDASNLPSGVYFYQLQAGKFIQTKKMILLK
jgi:hypothetical protein